MVSRSLGFKDLYNWRDLGASTLLGIGTAFIGPLLNVILVAWLLSTVYELFNPVINGIRINLLGYQSFGWAWYIWLTFQFLDDYSFYWYHRLSHTVRLFWPRICLITHLIITILVQASELAGSSCSINLYFIFGW